jgi:signal transduction histidine kinase/DNA-binding NarL/FixJ family response regulator
MKNGPLIEALLHNQGFAVFHYLGEGRFRRIGQFPEWFLEIGGAKSAREESVELEDRFPFVQNFLTDAEEVWKAESGESKNSGSWIEKGADGRELAIEASALWLLGMRLLVIRNPQETYLDQSRWLQTARQSRLKHDRLGREIQKKEILLHCIIHDLSQPLSAMRGCFSCMEMENPPEAIHKLAETGLKQSQMQEAMIREILEVFSEELATHTAPAGKLAEPADVARIAAEVVKDYSAAFAEKGARIELDRAVDWTSEWKVAGDESRLRRIFANLVENSLRVSPPKSAVVLGAIGEGRFVRAFVDDEGPGFPGGQPPEKLFSLFGKGKEHGGKAGLGLYFCRIMVEQWGGTIGCEQRPKGGARFWFRLPRADRTGYAASAAAKAQELPATDGGRKAHAVRGDPRTPGNGGGAQENGKLGALERTWRPLRVLVADDEEVNQEIVAMILERRGHTAVAATNGREAVEAVVREHFDAILMDHEMPKMKGTEATKAIRQKERGTGKHIPIIGVTGFALTGGREECLAAGMDACLPKPFQVNELCDTIESLIFFPGAKAPDAAASTDSSAPDKSPLAYLGDDRKVVRRLVAIFLVDSVKRLAAIRRAISRRDAEQLKSVAHALAGSVGVFDATTVAAAARKLEAMGRSGDFNGIDAGFESLAQELDHLNAHLRTLVPQAAGRKIKPKTKTQIRTGRKKSKK